MINRLSMALLCVFALGVSTSTMAGEEFKSQIKARQSFMQVLAYNNGILGAMAKGKMDYNAELAQAAASNLALAAKMNNGSMWPQGSDLDNSDNTVAKAAIWTTWPEAGDFFGKLSTAANGLELEAGNGVDAMKLAMKDVGKTCGGCHKKFRAKK